MEDSYHYNLVGRAIGVIAEAQRAGEPPRSLDDIAQEIGLSPAHFQRVFSQWAGVSPKRYMQYLTLDHARQLLSERRNVLDTALDTGLSGAGRLHDLFVRWEAMTPGEYAQGGAGLEIAYGWFETPFGPVLTMGTARGLCGLAFAAEVGRDRAMADLTGRWPAAHYAENPALLEDWVGAAFGSGGEARIALMGGPFQIKVWEALLQIPSGQVTTYSEIAQAIGNPKAVRAVGTAIGRNPISWLIPCHRVLRKNGALGGYHWGQGVKHAMLVWEAARADGAGQPA